ncbi:MAG: serine/threonine protein kinase [Candidatus Riflebacteria bacterium]|nr:serine/threonine protein kinase [Candidatus Riflebacteria bacterium]
MMRQTRNRSDDPSPERHRPGLPRVTNPFPPRCSLRYAPVEVLASGGFGTVWLAEQRDLHRLVVVKMLHQDLPDEPEARARFLDEARITASLSHPHVVIVLDHDVEGSVPWIALEYLPGRTLRQIVSTGALSIRSALVAAIQIASALGAAHDRGIIHRDIKPENVIEVEPDRYKVADFGIAKWAEGGRVRTQTGVVVGTPAYLAPEIIQGDPASCRSDLYSLGTVLYELLAGRLPFPGDSPMHMLESHLRGDLVPPGRFRPEIPPAVEAMVLWLLARDPLDRPASAEAARSGLEPLLELKGGSRSSPARPVQPAGPVESTLALSTGRPGHDRTVRHADRPRTGSRRPWAGVAVAVGLLCLGSVAGRECRRSGAPLPPPSTPSPTLPRTAAPGSAKAIRIAEAARLLVELRADKRLPDALAGQRIRKVVDDLAEQIGPPGATALEPALWATAGRPAVFSTASGAR